MQQGQAVTQQAKQQRRQEPEEQNQKQDHNIDKPQENLSDNTQQVKNMQNNQSADFLSQNTGQKKQINDDKENVLKKQTQQLDEQNSQLKQNYREQSNSQENKIEINQRATSTHKQQQDKISAQQKSQIGQNASQNLLQKQSYQENKKIKKIITTEQMFKRLNQNKNDYISAQELQILNLQMKQNLDQKNVREFLREVEKNKKNKISLEQFKIWWKEKSKKKPITIQSIIQMQKQIVQQLKKFAVLSNQGIDKLEIGCRVGHEQKLTKLKYSLVIKEEKFKAQIQSLKARGINFNQQKLRIILELDANKPNQLKEQLNNLITNLKENQNELMNKLQFTVLADGDSLLLQITSTKLQQQFKELIAFFRPKAYQSDVDSMFIDLEGELSLKKGLHNNLKNKFVKWFCEGFHKYIKVSGNSQVICKVRKTLQNYLPVQCGFLGLFKSGKLNINFKSTENIQKIFKQLGINDLAQNTPSLQDLICQLIDKYNQLFQSQDYVFFLRKIINFILLNLKSQVQIWIFVAQTRLRMTFSSDNLEEVSAIIKKKLK